VQKIKFGDGKLLLTVSKGKLMISSIPKPLPVGEYIEVKTKIKGEKGLVELDFTKDSLALDVLIDSLKLIKAV
jgi:hypothetical protein